METMEKIERTYYFFLISCRNASADGNWLYDFCWYLAMINVSNYLSFANIYAMIVIAPGQTNMDLFRYLLAKLISILNVCIQSPGQK